MVVDYSLAKIYKMTSPNGLTYIGSTCEPNLARRLASHKREFNQCQKGRKSKCSSYELIEEDYDNIIILLIEKYPCNDKDELRAREGHWIREIECVNKRIAGRNRKQYYEENKEIIKEKQKIHHEDNKDKINEKLRTSWASMNREEKDKYNEHKRQYRLKKKLEKIALIQV